MPSPYLDPADRRPHCVHAEYAHVLPRRGPQPVDLNIASEGDGWSLNLPRETGAAVAYLRGLERARAVELDAIRTLRQRIEGQSRPHRLRPSRRGVVAILAALLIAVGAAMQFAPRLLRPASTSSSQTTGHEGHTSMGSGVAVELSDTQVTPTRATAAAGSTTFILRNTGVQASEFLIVPQARVNGTAARMTPQQLHDAAIAAKHDVEPGTRVELTAQLAAGEYLLVANHADGAARSTAFSVR
jgi:uncharacterized cupredoxin-like copper-binding protein